MNRIVNISMFIILLAWASSSVSAQDPWIVKTDQPLQGNYYGITSANGQIGLLSSRNPLQVDKVIIGGLYDICGTVRVNNYFPNINPLDIELRVDGEKIGKSNISAYTQQMNFRNAAFRGTFDFADKVSVTYSTMALRHLPYGFMTDVTVVAKADCQLQVLNQHKASEALRDPQGYISYIDNKANPFTEQYPSYCLMTTTALSPGGKHQLAATTAFMFPGEEAVGTPYAIIHRDNRGVGRHTMEFAHNMAAGDTLHFCLVGTIIASNVVPDTRNEAERLTVYQLLEGYERILSRHNKAWEQLWESDILIDGDPQAQQDIHSMLYHLYAFFREGNPFGCSPMGLSGLGYAGHVFWDSETWMFPVLLLMQPDLAREMLQYRSERLPMAMNNAYMHGYKGAMFPWESAGSGQEETSPHAMYPSLEQHVTGDIALACWQYYQLTRDKQWLHDIGYPILRSTADFWVSRIEDNGDIICVTGANEWNSNSFGGKQVNNDAFTIGVAKTNLQYAAKAAKALGEQADAAWQTTADKLQWKYLDGDIIASHDGYHGEVTKQASVALLAYPLQMITDKQAILHNLEYYIATVPEQKTPAMSKSIYATLYARLDMPDKALYWWRDSYLPNLNPPFRVVAEFNGGTNPYFLTGAGGTLQALLFGFAGLDITDKGLKQTYKPVLPDEWTALTIRRKGQKDIRLTK